MAVCIHAWLHVHKPSAINSLLSLELHVASSSRSYDLAHHCNTSCLYSIVPCVVQREGTPDPHEKSQNIGFLSNIGPDPLKNHIANKPPAFNFGSSSHFNGV